MELEKNSYSEEGIGEIEVEKRCENCLYFVKAEVWISKLFGNCIYSLPPLPQSIFNEYVVKRRHMAIHDGRDCVCYKKKTEGNIYNPNDI